ncbi:MAG: TIGR01244 family sulfur transferase [Paracoccaceae bacterium]
MNIKELQPGFSVAGQIEPGHMPALAKHGIRGVICNRPDGEQAGQPDFALVEAAAKAEGIEIRYIPIVPGLAGMPEVEAFREALKTLPGPILAYCRSGARSSSMFDAAKSNA